MRQDGRTDTMTLTDAPHNVKAINKSWFKDKKL
jgi:hypothetical protein